MLLLSFLVSIVLLCECFSQTISNCNFTSLEAHSFSSCKNVSFTFENGTVQLNTDLNFKEFSKVTLIGLKKVTTIECSNDVGIIFENVSSVVVQDIEFLSCGSRYNYTIFDRWFGVIIIGSGFTHVYRSAFRDSQGIGLTIVNSGNITIEECEFTNNTRNASESNIENSGGGGLYIESRCENTSVTVASCIFTYNRAEFANNETLSEVFVATGNGGGMKILLCGATGNTILISDSEFVANQAAYGGGAQIVLTNESHNNYVYLNNINFSSNCAEKGGGGLDIGYVGFEVQNNSINFTDLHFYNNNALFGGGCAIFSFLEFKHDQNKVEVQNCTWTQNIAHYGSAIILSPYRTESRKSAEVFVFTHCNFISNYVKERDIQENVKQIGKGIFMVTGSTVTFNGNTNFISNNSTSLHAISSVLLFKKYATAVFQNNSARNGAGMFLIGFSMIIVAENVNLTFSNNFVTYKGAAIHYFSIDKNAYINKKACFIQRLSSLQKTESVCFNFFGNTALQNPGDVFSEQRPNSIYANTLDSCTSSDGKLDFGGVAIFRSCKGGQECNGVLNKEVLLTDKNISEVKKRHFFTPGQKFNLSFTNPDALYDVTISHQYYGNITVPRAFSVMTSNKLLLNGNPGDIAILSLTEKSFRKYLITFEVEAKDCPPLYKIDNGSCICSSTEDFAFVEFHVCFNKTLAKIRFGYWIHYMNKSEQKASNNLNNSNDRFIMLTSYCPLGYCNSISTDNDSNYLIMPDNNSLSNLDEVICSNRTGILCGHCMDGTVVYFHSETFKCGDTKLCYLGPLFYILSEILPITFLFLLVIAFNISFTSGNLNGFIFFAQMYDSISKVGGSFVPLTYQFHKLSIVHRLVYKVFNMDFFDEDQLSFCLFKTRSALDILVVKYLTIAYALILVLGTVWLINLCSKCRVFKFRKAGYSVINGLSAFLVLVYSQSTSVSLEILNPINIYAGKEFYKRVVFFDGNIVYFRESHIYYAVPALLILILVTSLPLLLIYYPLCNKVIALLGLENNCAVRVSSRLFPILKIKPLLDSFQGTFKDNYRFFAGLYFIYRLTILSSRFATGAILIFTIIEIQLIAMLVLHTLCWPYQKKIHNIVDLIIFANLAIINSLKLLNFFYAENGQKEEKRIHKIQYVQLFFIYIPLFGLTFWILYLILAGKIKLLKQKFRQRARKVPNIISGEEVEEFNDNDFISDYRRSSFASESYQMLKRNKLETIYQ